MNNKRFYALDAFRGLCAVSVVLYHLHIENSITDLIFFRNSDIFVEMFFCLSGFVMCHSYGQKRIDNIKFSEFFKSRFFRLYPLHFTMLLVYIALELLKLISSKYFNFNFNVEPFTGVYSVNEIIPNLFLIQSWSFYTEAYSFNTPSWSISVEFYMYFLLYITLFFDKAKIYIWFFICVIAFLFLYSNNQTLTSYSLRGLSCFFLGCIVYKVYSSVEKIRVSYLLGSLIEVLILIFIYLSVVSDIPNKSITLSLFFSLVILIFSFEFGIISKVLKHHTLQTLGKLSYSIYLVHAALIFIMLSVLMVLGKFLNLDLTPMINDVRYMSVGGGGTANLFVLAILILVVIVSSVTYEKIEVKFVRVGKSNFFGIGCEKNTN
ncbi:acyltransferase family protein [Vibrio cyclitrophicus]|uniref:Acyltransferase n=1 Tax=Vibrio cyclitrophicus ZF270 TaxID=1136176 RepID=A0AAN0LLK8_9VIBR|nr:acyltransferase [Vibrio cyclitrophicus]OEE04268.1 hypothetical protein OC7_10510 [Vibrio cyclitrophicus ZF270]